MLTIRPHANAELLAARRAAGELNELWLSWTLDDRFEETGLALASECEKVREEAATRLSLQDGRWQEAAAAVAGWCRDARAAIAAMTESVPAKQADDWLRGVHDDLHAIRMETQGQDARLCWQMMRQQSNIELGEIRLSGRGGSRKAELNVSIDNIRGSALGVMMPQIPFRFLVIDDPVQSMDLTKVDGLARLLDQAARTRQVIVFTHDSRLPDAVQRLGITATTFEVHREEYSEVEIRLSTASA